MIGWLDDRRLGTVAKGCCCREKERRRIKMASCMRVPLLIAAKAVGDYRSWRRSLVSELLVVWVRCSASVPFFYTFCTETPTTLSLFIR